MIYDLFRGIKSYFLKYRKVILVLGLVFTLLFVGNYLQKKVSLSIRERASYSSGVSSTQSRNILEIWVDRGVLPSYFRDCGFWWIKEWGDKGIGDTKIVGGILDYPLDIVLTDIWNNLGYSVEEWQGVADSFISLKFYEEYGFFSYENEFCSGFFEEIFLSSKSERGDKTFFEIVFGRGR